MSADNTTKGDPVAITNSELHQQLAKLVEAHGLPGATVAVLNADGSVAAAAAGVLNTRTGQPATTDSLFQIGSVTKVWTATMVLQLVDEGLVSLDSPVRAYLPELRVSDESAAATITVRQLLSHTSGIDGDFFVDTGRGADAIALYVEAMKDAAQLFPPGLMRSYCNAGWVVLGRLIEKVTAQTYSAALHERLIRPLGLTHTVDKPEDALLFRTAVGHRPGVPGSEGGGAVGPIPADKWMLPHSLAPAGSTITMTATELLAFARLHIGRGEFTASAADGADKTCRLLSAEAADEMATVHALTLGGADAGYGAGLGWGIYTAPDGRKLLQHNGGTIGQSSFLRVVPDRNVAVALLTNGPGAEGVSKEILGSILSEQAGFDLPGPTPAPPLGTIDLDPAFYAGTFRSAGVDFETTVVDGRVRLVVIQPPGRAATESDQTHWLIPITAERLLIDGSDGSLANEVLVTDPQGMGRATHITVTGRVSRRVEPAA